MPFHEQVDMHTERSEVDSMHTLLAIPPNFYSIPFGLVGLARGWRLASNFYGLPVWIGNALFLLAAVIFLLFLVLLIIKLLIAPKMVLADLTNSAVGPFFSLLPIIGMLLAVGLAPYALSGARVLFLVFFVATVLIGGWYTGQWIIAALDADKFGPGYFLPTVAGGILGADSAASFGLTGLAWISFGLGIISWLMLSPIILNRLYLRPNFPAALIPTLAIVIVPSVIAGNAYFTLTGNRVDPVAYILAGYTVLMALVQLRLLTLYLKLPFSPGLWSFTFSYAATAAYALRWLHLQHFAGATLLGYIVLAAITLFIGGILLRSLIALGQGTFLPRAGNS
ncbi:dicarboxylate transporter/tellurite-resistance protein TehA [Dictyobacter alpinus]|uniref:Dicarboxylate transporter/tellurite-resistance protein TehA n=1 Tax=Dictyobacter alpinus TaxID=2014873 RepID=A0A402BBH6_9CHLR|nr:TDT family transporter [Dictyobacter alpinus]GCE28781.1 dicarboxylate transporter/tellurite-resistance protein TehA [Dictyobacter alpinus]